MANRRSGAVKESSLARLLTRSWQNPNWLTLLLWPFSQVYRALFALRTQLYRLGILRSYTAPVPVVIVGNLSVGGTGKTPLVIFLIERLRDLGFRPGVISRGYGSNALAYPALVSSNMPVSQSGDEPALIHRRTGAPMAIGPDREADIKLLLESADVDVIVSDDGLQHLALNRKVEICLMDDTSPSLNRNLLPAGPLRESLDRLNCVDLVVRHQANLTSQQPERSNEFSMSLEPTKPCSIGDKKVTSFDFSRPIHAVAGIGNPQRFFNTCRELDLEFTEHSFTDHHCFTESDLDFGDDLPILMTEKDAVKCEGFANSKHWYLPVNAKLSDGFIEMLSQQLK